MTLQNVVLSPEQEAFIRERVETAGYADAADVVREALDQMMGARADGSVIDSSFQCATSEEELDAMLQEGIDSGVVAGDPFAEVFRKHGLSASRG